MNEQCECKFCKKQLNPDWSYCPWCGESSYSESPLPDIIDNCFNKLERVYISEKIKNISSKLDSIEVDINDFLDHRQQ